MKLCSFHSYDGIGIYLILKRFDMIKRKRYYYMDFLAIISCFAVVVLHTSAAPGNENIDLRAFHSSSVIIALINILFSFAVPVFFM